MLVLLSVTLIAVDHRLGPLRSAVGTALGPVQRALGGAVGSDSRLRRDNERLRQELSAERLDAARAGELRRLHLLAGGRVIAGRVVALSGPAGGESAATIGVGTRDGVGPGMTVVDGDGLVGRVLRALPATSVVLLAVDPASSVGARLAGSGQLGLCRGAGRRPLRLTLLDARARVDPGDRVLTGPSGATTFAPGVPIGRVRAVSRSTDGLVRTAEVDPYVDFTALDLVGVVIPPR